jgi:hypothetical protein
VELQAGQKYSMLGLHSGRARERGAATEQEVSNQREVHKEQSRQGILSHGVYLILSTLTWNMVQKNQIFSYRNSSTRKLGFIPQPFQAGGDHFAVVSLDLDIPIFDRAAAPADFLQQLGQCSQVLAGKLQIANHCDRLPSPPFDLPLDGCGLLLRRQAFRLWAAARVAPAARAALGKIRVCRVNGPVLIPWHSLILRYKYTGNLSSLYLFPSHIWQSPTAFSAQLLGPQAANMIKSIKGIMVNVI